MPRTPPPRPPPPGTAEPLTPEARLTVSASGAFHFHKTTSADEEEDDNTTGSSPAAALAPSASLPSSAPATARAQRPARPPPPATGAAESPEPSAPPLPPTESAHELSEVASSGAAAAAAGAAPVLPPLPVGEVRWFFKIHEDGEAEPKDWQPFCLHDSRALEEMHRASNEKHGPVTVLGGLYDVSVLTRSGIPVFWSNELLTVLRGTWFKAKSERLEVLEPCSEHIADIVEAIHRNQPWGAGEAGTGKATAPLAASGATGDISTGGGAVLPGLEALPLHSARVADTKYHAVWYGANVVHLVPQT